MTGPSPYGGGPGIMVAPFHVGEVVRRVRDGAIGEVTGTVSGRFGTGEVEEWGDDVVKRDWGTDGYSVVRLAGGEIRSAWPRQPERGEWERIP